MFALVTIVLAGIVGIIGLLVYLTQKEEDRNLGGLVAVVAFLIAIIVMVVGSVATVPNGNVGVMVRFGKTTGQIIPAGFNWKPLIDNAVRMSIQTQLFADDATAASKDLQDVTATIAINYKLDPKQASVVYRTIGQEYIKVIAHPLIQETVKEVTSRYNAEDMILRRADVKLDMTDEITAKMAERGIITEEVNITNFSFSDVFDSAIEAKVVAVQKVLEAENKLWQIEVEARQAEQKAKGDAAAAVARANGQAEANKIIDASLTEKVLRYYFIDQVSKEVKVWVVPDGQVFTVTP